jgi:hypothetical protein
MEKLTIGSVPGSTSRYAIIDSERENGSTLEGHILAKVPKNVKPGSEVELVFVVQEVWPTDPTWDGHGEHPAVIRARHDEQLREELDANAGNNDAEGED